jgi:hypothetical protein
MIRFLTTFLVVVPIIALADDRRRPPDSPQQRPHRNWKAPQSPHPSREADEESPQAPITPNEANSAAQLQPPLQLGRRDLHMPPFLFTGTWPFAHKPGPVQITPLYVDIEADQFTLVFELKGGEKGSSFMWPYKHHTPRGIGGSEWESLYVVDSNSRKVDMKSYHVDGGKLDDWGKPAWGSPVVLLELSPCEAVQFSVTYPMVSKGARSVTFYCPQLNGWQSAFSLKAIALRDFTPDEESAEEQLTTKAGSPEERFAIESARSRGADAGYKDGLLAGDTEGFQAGLRAAEESSYSQTLSELYSSDNYHRVPIYSLAVLLAAFLAGFALQYVILYLLRVTGFLSDIDGIILPHQATAVNLKDLAGREGRTPSTYE